MLKIYDEMLEAVRGMRGMIGDIERRDPDLARQLRRAASSVVAQRGRGQRLVQAHAITARCRRRLSGARARAARVPAGRRGARYVDGAAALGARIDHVIGTLVKVSA